MKKFFALVLSIFMLIGNSVVFAEDTTSSEKLEKIILSVKEKIDIPEEYTEFDYSFNSSEDKNLYYLNWTKESNESNNDKQEITVSIDEDGNIFSYSFFDMKNNENDFSKKKSKQECLKVAEDFLKKVLPNNYSEFKLFNSNGNENFVFKQFKNDVPVRFNQIEIYVDPVNLNVITYEFSNADYLNCNFEDLTGIIDKEKAFDLISSNIKLEPEYIFNYDYKTKEKNVFLVYSPRNFFSKAIEAKTSKLIHCDEFNNSRYTNEKLEYSKDSSESEGLSEKEIAEIESSKNLLSKEEANLEIQKLLPKGVDLKEMLNANLSKDLVDVDKYIWNIEYDNGYASINAKTKQLIHFMTYNFDEIDEKDSYDGISQEKKDKAYEYIKKVAPDKVNNIKLIEENSNYWGLNYVRQINGFNFLENAIDITFDKDGNIESYACFWYDSIEFPKENNIMNKNDILGKIRNIAGFDLNYEICKRNTESDVVLAYSFNDFYKLAPYFDAVNGKELNYNGSEYIRKFNIPDEYPDVKGHWCEKYVNMLLNNGIYVERELFLPDEKITKGEFFEVYGSRYGTFDVDFKDFKDNNGFITRKEMCNVITNIFNYTKLTDKDIFKNPFKDIDESFDGFGNMAIANALGIITADNEGKIYPDRFVTNAEVSKIICVLNDILS